jgi:hypothetical protein
MNSTPADLDKIEQLKALFTYGEKAIYATIVLNGGSIVATLSFSSAVLSKDTIPSPINFQITKLLITGSVSSFCFGLAIGSISYILAYLTQLDYYNDRFSSRNRFHRWIYFSIIISILAFAVGCAIAIYSIWHFLPG